MPPTNLPSLIGTLGRLTAPRADHGESSAPPRAWSGIRRSTRSSLTSACGPRSICLGACRWSRQRMSWTWVAGPEMSPSTWPRAGRLPQSSAWTARPRCSPRRRPGGLQMGSGGHVDWQLANLQEWHAGAPVDVLFSNAALHWLGHHDTLFPALFAQVAPAGVMAVQMPRNFDAPSHRIVADLAASSRWSRQLGDFVKPSPVHPPAASFGMADGLRCTRRDLGDGIPAAAPPPAAGAGMDQGTYLRPLLDRLSPAEQNECRRRVCGTCGRGVPGRSGRRHVVPVPAAVPDRHPVAACPRRRRRRH